MRDPRDYEPPSRITECVFCTGELKPDTPPVEVAEGKTIINIGPGGYLHAGEFRLAEGDRIEAVEGGGFRVVVNGPFPFPGPAANMIRTPQHIAAVRHLAGDGGGTSFGEHLTARGGRA